MPKIDEIAPDVFRISVHNPDLDLQFNHFLIRDEEPMLYHTGMREMFDEVREGVAQLIDVEKLRWIGFSHFEVDECGTLPQWYEVAPNSQAVCSLVGAMVNINSFGGREARGMTRDQTFETGKFRYRYIPTPHLPHGWDAGVMLEETQGTLFCSDLFHQGGEQEAVTDSNILDRVRDTMTGMQNGPLMDYMPYTPNTKRMLNELADLNPKSLAIMHGSSYTGDAEKALRDLAPIMKDLLGQEHA